MSVMQIIIHAPLYTYLHTYICMGSSGKLCNTEGVYRVATSDSLAHIPYQITSRHVLYSKY